MSKVSIPTDARDKGIHVVAGKGSGKSRLLGRAVAYRDFLAGVPVVLLDFQGGAIDNFLDRLLYLHPDIQAQLRDRVLYFDMSGKLGYVPGFPLYYRLPGDTLRNVAYRFLAITRRLDPDLVRAPVRGWNAIEIVGTNVGMVLADLGLPITEAASLLSNPAAWIELLDRVGYEAQPAADYFLDVYPRSREERERAEAFLPKIMPFTHDPVLQAMFTAPEMTINWADVLASGKAVLLDFRYERDPRFKVLWALTAFLEYIQLRGYGHPVSLIVDELAYLLSLNSSGYDLLSEDLDDLINRVARNSNLWLTLAHQEMHQLPEKIRATLMTLGTQIIGRTTDPDAAMDFARRFVAYRPDWVRKYETVYDRGMRIDNRSVEYTQQEQLSITSRVFLKLQEFEFAVITPDGTSPAGSKVSPLHLGFLDPGHFVNQPLVDQVKAGLARRSGLSVADFRPVRLRLPEPPRPEPMRHEAPREAAPPRPEPIRRDAPALPAPRVRQTNSSTSRPIPPQPPAEKAPIVEPALQPFTVRRRSGRKSSINPDTNSRISTP